MFATGFFRMLCIMLCVAALLGVPATAQDPDPLEAQSPEPAAESQPAAPVFTFDPEHPSTSARAVKPADYTARQKRALHRAEWVAKRFAQRYYETLNLDPLLDEMFVANVVWRYRVRNQFDQIGNFTPEMQASCDDENLRRVYVATADFLFAIAAYWYSTQKLDHKDAPAISSKYFPPEVVQAALNTRYLAAIARGSGDDESVASREDLEQFVQETTEITKRLVRTLPNRAFESAQFKANVAYTRKVKPGIFLERDPLRRSEEEVEVYNIPVDFFSLHILEESGDLKIFQVELLP